MHNTYWYDGPQELGSVIAHQCGAVGLFSSKENPDFIIHVSYKGIVASLLWEQEPRATIQSDAIVRDRDDSKSAGT